MVTYQVIIDNKTFKEIVLDTRSDDICRQIIHDNWKDLDEYNYSIIVIEQDKVEEISLWEYVINVIVA